MVRSPIFIVGFGRSGTTLLRSLLCAHSRIAIPAETHFMKRADKEGARERTEPADFEAFWSRFTSLTRFQDVGVDPDRCRALLAQQGDRSFRSVLAAVLEAYRERSGKARVGEKTPGHVYYIGRLLEWFPDARIVVLQRDPRAVVASQLRSPWIRGRLVPPSLRRGLVVRKRLYEAARLAAEWSHVYGRVVPHWRDDPRVHRLTYEALVGETEAELRSVCAFVGEEVEPGMISGRSERTVPGPSGQWERGAVEQWRREHYAKSRGPIVRESLASWTAELSRAEVAVIEGRCAREMRAAGYEVSFPAHLRAAGRVASIPVLAAGRAEGAARAAASRILSRPGPRGGAPSGSGAK